MRLLLISIMLCMSGVSWASDDISCEKKSTSNHVVHCKSKKDVGVALISINGGECSAPWFHRYVHSGESFEIPGTKECGYTRSITLSVSGHDKTFAPL